MRNSRKRLRTLRNEVEIVRVIKHLDLAVERPTHFQCPLCLQSEATTTASTANLARCFHCGESFNPIDLVVAAHHCSFLEAVRVLEALGPRV